MKRNRIRLVLGASVMAVSLLALPKIDLLHAASETVVAAAYTTSNSGTEGSTVTLKVKSGRDITEVLNSAIKNYNNIIIPAGSYTVTGLKANNVSGVTITAKDCNLKLVGDEPMLTVQSYAVTSGLTIDGGVWDANGSKAPAFRFNGKNSNIVLKNLTVKNSAVDGIRFNDTDGVTIEKVKVIDNGKYGIIMKDVKNGASVSKCYVKGNGDTGIALFNSNDIKIKSTTAAKNGSKKVNSGHGIYVNESTATFDDMTVFENYWCGISSTGLKSKIVVNRGEYYNNGTRPAYREENDDILSAGIGVYRGTSAIVTDVYSHDNHGSGIAIAGTKPAEKTNIKIYGCTITNNGDHGVGAHPYATVDIDSSAAVKRNTITGNKQNGILMSESCISSLINNVDISDNGNMGISFIQKSRARNITNCNIKSNSQYGIRFTKSSKLTGAIKNCKCISNGRSGIGAYDNSKINRITDCNVNNNKYCGVKIMKSTINVIDKVIANKNRESGISADTGIVSRISATTANSNKKYGLYVSKKSNVKVASLTTGKNKIDGVRVTGKGTRASLVKVNSFSNRQNGLIVTSEGTVKKLNGCTFKSNGKYGISVYNKCTLSNAAKNKAVKNKNKQIYIQEKAKTKLKTKL